MSVRHEFGGPSCKGTGDQPCRTHDEADWKGCMAALRSTSHGLAYFESHTKCVDPATEPTP